MRFKFASFLLLISPHLCVFGQEPGIDLPGEGPSKTVIAASSDQTVGVPDADSLELFVDGVLAAQFESHHLAGAVVTVVKDGSILLSKGYGRADLERGVPVDPETTLFRIGSVSKLFTWIAVMQLESEGKLDLNVDVNTYLKKVKVPETFDAPVTMKHLMTHTAGFEDRLIGLIWNRSEKIPSLEELLMHDLPTRVRAPGEISAYSNHGVALAGLVVQDVSGMPWQDYVNERVLKPLQMNYTSLLQPLPAGLRDSASVGYRWDGIQLEPGRPEIIPAAPAGAVSASANDMARFMVALLNDGRTDNGQLLPPNSVRRMLSPLASNDPEVSPMAHGFILQKINGHAVVGHGGSTIYFKTMLVLLPEFGTGLFVSYNAEDGSEAVREFCQAFYDRYFPGATKLPRQIVPGFQERAESIVGSYRSSRRAYTTLDKVMAVSSDMTVTVAGEGRLRTSGGAAGAAYWDEVEPNIYQNDKGSERLVFRVDSATGQASAFLGNLPILGYERLPWYDTVGFHLKLLVGCMVVLATPLFLPIVSWFCAARRRELFARPEPTHPLARALAGLLGLVFIGYLASLAFVLRDPVSLLDGVPPSMNLLSMLPLLGGILTIVLLIVNSIAWKGAYWTFFARLHFTLVTVSAMCLLWQLNYWNLLLVKLG